jgi:hypothetical protein
MEGHKVRMLAWRRARRTRPGDRAGVQYRVKRALTHTYTHAQADTHCPSQLHYVHTVPLSCTMYRCRLRWAAGDHGAGAGGASLPASFATAALPPLAALPSLAARRTVGGGKCVRRSAMTCRRSPTATGSDNAIRTYIKERVYICASE